MDKKVTTTDIKLALSKKHHKEFFITECKNGPTHYSNDLQILDALAIYKSWATPRLVGYEIKVSRSDFLRDSKFFAYLPLVHELYIITPTGLVDRTELPDSIGLMYYNPEKGTITTKKKAIYRKIDISADMLLYIIMNRLDSDRMPFYSEREEYYRAWVENKINNRELGYRVSNKMLKEVERLEGELRSYKHFKEDSEELNNIKAVMAKHGLNSFYRHAEKLDEALSKPYPMKLDIDLDRLHAVVSDIEKMRAEMG